MKNMRGLRLVASGVLAVSAASCGRQQPFQHEQHGQDRPLVSQLTTERQPLPGADTNKPLRAADRQAERLGATPASTAVTARVTLRKDRLFNREFLYGFDLQYSGGSDSKYSLVPQAQALGHLPCFFRRLDDKLQLVAEQQRLFESDINHPELLIAAYRILGEDDSTLTVEFASGGLVMNEALNGSHTDATDPAVAAQQGGAEPPKQVWIRSLSFVPEGEYLLQESALQLKNGTVQTFMESVFPRSNLVSGATKGIEANSQTEPLAARFRFLGQEDVYVPRLKGGVQVREKTSFAAHYLLGDKSTIDWYVTTNAPEHLLPVFKSGVEGWNRYFQPMLGRPVMRFLGRLPEGIKIGDPRYNVIDFDSVAQAGAAYASQAADPLTGSQSHSLIYLPYAWYNIGVEFWQRRSTDLSNSASLAELRSELEPKAPERIFGRGHKVLSCLRSMESFSLPLSTLTSAQGVSPDGQVPAEVDDFAKRLMISTLFHEVGHALGLDHNFKGSLSFDSSKTPGAVNPRSWSIMDYNYYQNEQDLFHEIGTSDGEPKEYDRQIISALYHGAYELRATDPVLPACNDQEADDTAGGSDPLCLRYDAENDPTLSLVHAYHNLVAAQVGLGVSDKTLSEALLVLKPRLAAKFADPLKLSSPEQLPTAVQALAGQMVQLISFYVGGGAQSLQTNLGNNAKALRLWKDAVKLDGEAAFRSRYSETLSAALALRTLPPAPAAAVQQIAAELQAAISGNPALGQDPAARTRLAQKTRTELTSLIDLKVVALLSKMRSSVYTHLAYDLKNPFALELAPGAAASHFEDLAAQLLAAGVGLGLEPKAAAAEAYAKTADDQMERIAAATALASFKGLGAASVQTTVQALETATAQALQAGQTKRVRDLRQLLALLK